MPKRIVDGEGVWGSDKILQLKEEYRPEYANLVPLAEANGVFEADAYKVWSRVYSYNRRDKDVVWVSGLLEDLVRVGLLLLWENKGKVWGFWEGNQKAGRLPSPSEQEKYKNLPDRPPRSLLSDSPENSISLLPRLGLVGSVKNRIGLDPAGLTEEELMKIQTEAKAVCEAFGVTPGGYKSDWDQMAILARTYKTGSVLNDLKEYLDEYRGDDFPRGAIPRYLQVASARLAQDAGPTAATLKDPEVVSLARELSYLSGGSVAFQDKQKIRLAETLKEFTAEEVTSVFKTWLDEQDLTDPKNLSFLPGKFVQIAGDKAYALRKSREVRSKESVERELTVKRLQEEAETNRAAAEAVKAEESGLFDPLA